MRTDDARAVTRRREAVTRRRDRPPTRPLTWRRASAPSQGQFLRAVVASYEAMDEDQFTNVVRDYDEISKLDALKTTLLLQVKNKIKAATDDIT